MSNTKITDVLRAFSENSLELMQSIRPDGTLEYVNQAWLNTLHYTESETLGISLKDFVFPGYVRRMRNALSAVMSGQRIQEFISTLQTKGGLPVRIEGSLFPRYNDKKIVAVGGIFQCVDKRAALLDRLMHERWRVDGLLDLMVHDLEIINEETNSIFRTALSTANLPESLAHLLQEGVSEVERSSGFLSNINKLWRIARRMPQLYRCDLGETLLRAKEIVETNLPHKELVLVTDLVAGHYFVTADEFLLEVITSLFYHIMRFDRRKQVHVAIEVTLLPQTPFLKMQIKDDGAGIGDVENGISSNNQSKGRKHSKGLGLELSLTKHVLDNYGGYLRLEERNEGVPEDGTNFVLLLRGVRRTHSKELVEDVMSE
ncbi:MAG: PAS domain-containing protein [Candidatus Thorarchaeota archaeon]